ncbi:hypothetical protein [Streptomyces tanashiensis]|uniref:hypothetical protein n=1 Tax=Streptomyces tanashiensis TaxID=67367 RepID=UPI003403D790
MARRSRNHRLSMRAAKKEMWTTHHFSLGIPAGSGQDVTDLLRTAADHIERLGDRWDVSAIEVGRLDTEDPLATCHITVFADPVKKGGA